MKSFKEKRLFIILFVGMFILLMLPLAFMGYFFLNAHTNMVTFGEFVRLNEEVIDNTEQIDIFLREVQGDVLFLSELSNLETLVNTDNKYLRDKAKINLENDFSSFSKEKKIFHQIRYIDENGQEIVKVHSEKGISEIIHNLQNKKDRYYFTETVNLESRELFISPLDLNVENGKIENRGTEEEPAYIPILRYATPVFDSEGVSKGIVIINTYAEYFLEPIHEEQRRGEQIFLLDHNGYYLSHPIFEKEFGFMFDNNENIYNDYPTIASNLLSNGETEILELGDLLVSFRYIYPHEEIIQTDELETQIKHESEDMLIKGTLHNIKDDNFWVLVTIESKEDVFSPSDNLKSEFLLIIFSTMFIVGLAFIIFFILISKKLKISNGERGKK